MAQADDDLLLGDLVRAVGGGERTKHQLAALLGVRGRAEKRRINRLLYRHEGTLFRKDRAPQEGLPIWSLIDAAVEVSEVIESIGEPAEFDIRPERWQRLREWQREAIEAWLAAGRAGIVEAVTGSGKSDVGIALAEHYLRSGGRVLVMVPTNVLKEQWAGRLRSDVCDHYGLKVVEISKSSSREWDSAPVLVAHPATVVRALESGRLDPESIGLVIADEVHHFGAPVWRKALSDFFFGGRLGLSATIDRSEDSYDEVFEPYFGGVVYELPFSRAYGHDLIAPFRMAYVGCSFSDQEQADYEAAELQYSSANKRLLRLCPELQELSGSAFYGEVTRIANSSENRQRSIAAGMVMKALTEQRQLRASCEAKRLALPQILELSEYRDKGLIFTATKQAADDALVSCGAAGVVGEVISSETPRNERPGILERFKAGKTRVLIGPKTLDEGLDVPEADFGVIVAASQSRREMVQRFGRLLRKKPDGRDAAVVVLYVIGTNEDPSHAARDGFIDDLEDLAEPECRTFADRDMLQLLAFLRPEA